MNQGKQPASLPLCPSAQADWQGSVVFGIVGGTAEEPRSAGLPEPLPVTPELLRMAQPATPAEVFRVAAPCACSGCQHFHEAQCRLVTRIVQRLPVVAETLPPCAIRPHCRWWQQEGKAACLRCPQVVTDNYNPSEAMQFAARPDSPIAASAE